MLFSAYRKDDYADPDGFLVQLGSVLETYPEWVVKQVTDPRTGIQRTAKFPPSIAEVTSACEALYGPVRYAEEWNDRAREQAQLRPPAAPPRQARGRVVTWADVQKMESEGLKPKVNGYFET